METEKKRIKREVVSDKTRTGRLRAAVNPYAKETDKELDIAPKADGKLQRMNGRGGEGK